ncbi:MAG: hypothetical protein EOO52_18010 [Gammaproteobacteria bacterium]|nr:MAG: hypothetical protein EOO52_18010 [Gammaproteobacteria bacterium]
MRDDVSNKLVHLTKGIGEDPKKHREEAFRILEKILGEKTLKGGTGFIRGGHRCVCFSEAPITKLSHILATKENNRNFKYQPYGIMVEKKWLYQKNGRPVIYGPSDDYELLPDAMKHRHVCFSLEKQEVDYTWEREWRVKTEELTIEPADVTIVVPNRIAKDSFFVAGYKDWHYIVLSDLGVKIDAVPA